MCIRDRLWDAGDDWGVWAVATAVALGDTDGNGAAEVGITPVSYTHLTLPTSDLG